MFLSTLLGTKRIMAMYSILATAPPEIKREIDDTTIVYRGIVSSDGTEGDLLLRLKGNRVYNVVWKEDYGEVREIERGLLNSLIKLYDSFIQDVVVHEKKNVIDSLHIINQKIELKETKFKKVKPL
ncbi:MAG: hypothetical protein ACP5H8_02230 [Candidatus Micrarchaeia archaeon]